MAVVDYINIVKHDDQKDWKTQIQLQIISSLYLVSMILNDIPYQIDATGEARLLKASLIQQIVALISSLPLKPMTESWKARFQFTQLKCVMVNI